MTIPDPELHGIVNELAIAQKKLANIEEEVAKLKDAQDKVAVLRAKLVGMLDRSGFTEEAVDLLLAAR